MEWVPRLQKLLVPNPRGPILVFSQKEKENPGHLPPSHYIPGRREPKPEQQSELLSDPESESEPEPDNIKNPVLGFCQNKIFIIWQVKTVGKVGEFYVCVLLLMRIYKFIYN